MARKRASMREGPLAELFRATEAAQRQAERQETGQPEAGDRFGDRTDPVPEAAPAEPEPFTPEPEPEPEVELPPAAIAPPALAPTAPAVEEIDEYAPPAPAAEPEPIAA